MAVILCPKWQKIGMEYTFCFSLSSGREEFLGIGKMHQGKVLGSMAKYLPLRQIAPCDDRYVDSRTDISHIVLIQSLGCKKIEVVI